MNITLHTKRLTLRPLTAADTETVFAYGGDPENTAFMLFLPYDSAEEARTELKKAERKMSAVPCRDYFFAIERNGCHIGEISLELNAAGTEAELGWILRKDCHGMGYMTEAAHALLNFASSLPHLRLLYAHCDSRNHASAAIMKRLGMTLTAYGIRRNRGSGQDSEDLTFALSLQS